jgi:hypothetical protein
MNTELLTNEKASLNRPAWTSTVETGMWHAYRHLHIPDFTNKGEPVKIDHYTKVKGLR